MATNDSFEFLRRANLILAEEYNQIHKKAAEDPGSAGEQGEENWTRLLRQWLPEYYRIVTRGRIVGPDGASSAQIDVLVLSPSYPKALLDAKLYLAGGVVAAFECKNTLKTVHITEFFQNCIRIRALAGKLTAAPRNGLRLPIYYGLLAHSHDSKEEKSRAAENVQRAIRDADLDLVKEPGDMPDIVCVSDLGVWNAARYMVPQPAFTETNPDGLDVATGYIAFLAGNDQPADHTVVGLMLTSLYRKLAWTDGQMRDTARCLDNGFTFGNAGGVIRRWSESSNSEVFQHELRKKSSRIYAERAYGNWHPVVH